MDIETIKTLIKKKNWYNKTYLLKMTITIMNLITILYIILNTDGHFKRTRFVESKKFLRNFYSFVSELSYLRFYLEDLLVSFVSISIVIYYFFEWLFQVYQLFEKNPLTTSDKI